MSLMTHEDLNKLKENNERNIKLMNDNKNDTIGDFTAETITFTSFEDIKKLIDRVLQLEEYLKIEDKVIAELREENNKLKNIKEEAPKDYGLNY